MRAIRPPGWVRRLRRRVISPAWAARLRSDRGDSVVEFAVVFPAVLVLVFLVIEGGLYFHARSVAAHAAQIGADAGRLYDAQPGDGSSAAYDFLRRTGESVEDPSVAVNTTGNEIAVTVSGDVASLVPGLSLTVSQTVQAPIEEFR